MTEILDFQDFIARALYDRGLVLVNFQSKEAKRAHGENMLGMEIKFDRKWRDTGNLYIEVAEKSHPAKPRMVPSGIARGDSWLYCIGDRGKVWIFATNITRMLVKKWGGKGARWERRTKTTSVGYLVPLRDADRFAALVVDLEPVPMTEGFNEPAVWWEDANEYGYTTRLAVEERLTDFKLYESGLKRKRRTVEGWRKEWVRYLARVSRYRDRNTPPHGAQQHEAVPRGGSKYLELIKGGNK